jgi:hypothetical protein
VVGHSFPRSRAIGSNTHGIRLARIQPRKEPLHSQPQTQRDFLLVLYKQQHFSFHVTMNNLLESQVTDLTYLAESPIVLSTSMNDQRQSSSAESPADVGNGSGKKRKGEETNGNGTTHTRAKRNRYISIAWYVQNLVISSSRDSLEARFVRSMPMDFSHL